MDVSTFDGGGAVGERLGRTSGADLVGCWVNGVGFF